jgi:hypothetical protein
MNGKAHQLGRIVAGLALVASIAMLAAQSAAAVDGRSPDTRAAAQPAGGGVAMDVRSPDARDAAEPAGASAERTLASSSEGFDWGDFGLGAGIAAASLLLVAVLAAAGMSGRRRSPTTV